MPQVYRVLALTLAILSLLACAAPAPKTAPYPLRNSYAEIFSDIDTARATAIRDDKLLMLVLGANWCHDSKGFAKKIHNPTISPLLEDRYQVQMINVGYLHFIREIVAAYDVPVIYGTPTVLVIEPVTNVLLNRETLPYWRNADNISIDDTRTYFAAFSPHQSLPATPIPAALLRQALAQIDQFEQEQAERIYSAYAALGPMLEKIEAGQQPSAEFDTKWKQLATMRSGITEDLQALHNSAAEQAASGATEIQLDFPHYALFID